MRAVVSEVWRGGVTSGFSQECLVDSPGSIPGMPKTNSFRLYTLPLQAAFVLPFALTTRGSMGLSA